MVRKLFVLFFRELKSALRDSMTIVILIMPVLMAIGITLFAPGINDTTINFALLNSDDPVHVEYMEEYAKIRGWSSPSDKLPTGVGKWPVSLVRKYAKQNKLLQLMLEGKLPEGTPGLNTAMVHLAEDKARMYARMYGKSNFDEGGAFVDIPYVIKKYGIVPEEVYAGLNYGSDSHNHAEMAEILRKTMDAVVSNKQKGLTTQWDDAVSGILDAYLGEVPEVRQMMGILPVFTRFVSAI